MVKGKREGKGESATLACRSSRERRKELIKDDDKEDDPFAFRGAVRCRERQR